MLVSDLLPDLPLFQPQAMSLAQSLPPTHPPLPFPSLLPHLPPEMYRTLKSSDKLLGSKFLAQCVVNGRSCWTRRLLKLASSPILSKPPPVSPCTSYMRNASAVSVSLISASTCGLPTTKQVDAAAYALVTAASKNGCSFSSAISSVSLAGEGGKETILE